MTTDPDECDLMADYRARHDDQDPPDYAADHGRHADGQPRLDEERDAYHAGI